MSDVTLNIGVTILRGAVPKEGDLEAKLRAVMARARDEIWFTTDPDVLLRCSVGAVMAHYGQGSEEYDRLAHEVKALRLLSAGLVVGNLDALLRHQEREDAPEIVGIMKIWREVDSTDPPQEPQP